MKSMTVMTTPVPKGRPRFYNGHAVTPPKTRAYEALLRQSWPHGVQEGPLTVVMAFVLPIPQSLSKRKKAELNGREHTKKPDLDNLVKAVLDALNGTAYADDSAITHIMAGKIYGSDPSITIAIERNNGNEEQS